MSIPNEIGTSNNHTITFHNARCLSTYGTDIDCHTFFTVYLIYLSKFTFLLHTSHTSLYTFAGHSSCFFLSCLHLYVFIYATPNEYHASITLPFTCTNGHVNVNDYISCPHLIYWSILYVTILLNTEQNIACKCLVNFFFALNWCCYAVL